MMADDDTFKQRLILATALLLLIGATDGAGLLSRSFALFR
jgi:hypothetical protein